MRPSLLRRFATSLRLRDAPKPPSSEMAGTTTHVFRSDDPSAAPALPTPTPASAQEASRPLDVRRRRADPSSQFEYTGKGILSPKQELDFRRARAYGWPRTENAFPPASEASKAVDEADEEALRRAYIAERMAWRSRTRGVEYPKGYDHSRPFPTADDFNERDERGVQVKKTNVTVTTTNPVFLPNLIFRMVRNNTPPGRPYNPYEATFRIPQSCTKLDVRNYLQAVYGVQTTYIRTDNRIPEVRRTQENRLVRKAGKSGPGPAYKRAVVGLIEPFYFPDPPKASELEELYQRDTRAQYRARMAIKLDKGWRWRGANGRGAQKRTPHVLAAIAAKRAEREGKIAEEAKRILAEASA